MWSIYVGSLSSSKWKEEGEVELCRVPADVVAVLENQEAHD